MTDRDISVIIPAKDEGVSIGSVIKRIKAEMPGAEILVVDDGSTDNTSEICEVEDVKVIVHPYSKGNGAAIKSGAREAKGAALVFMDADGQHRPEDIKSLLSSYSQGYDMVIGARQGRKSQASLGRGVANGFYNALATYITGRRVVDLTSGFRVVNAKKFREFLYLLPNGFSYPTTITMAFFRAGYSIKYESIVAEKRKGKSHIKIFRDGTRFFLIIFKVGTLYSPLKVFAPLAMLQLIAGLGWYAYTLSAEGRFTNMSALLMTSSAIVFTMGLISEQITALIYKD